MEHQRSTSYKYVYVCSDHGIDQQILTSTHSTQIIIYSVGPVHTFRYLLRFHCVPITTSTNTQNPLKYHKVVYFGVFCQYRTFKKNKVWLIIFWMPWTDFRSNLQKRICIQGDILYVHPKCVANEQRNSGIHAYEYTGFIASQKWPMSQTAFQLMIEISRKFDLSTAI